MALSMRRTFSVIVVAAAMVAVSAVPALAEQGNYCTEEVDLVTGFETLVCY